MKKALIIGGGGIADGIAMALDNIDYGYKIIDKDLCDVRNSSRVWYWMQKQKPDVVICTAGISHVASIKDSKVEEWSDEIYTNLIGSYHVAKHAIDAGAKTLIFIGSVAGMYGKPEHSGYSASKRGVISLVQSLGMEGYNAYAISPGRVDTKMREQDYPGEDPETRLKTIEIGHVVQDILSNVNLYKPGDNIIIRRIGTVTQPIKVDRGEPWKSDLKVGQPPAV